MSTISLFTLLRLINEMKLVLFLSSFILSAIIFIPVRSQSNFYLLQKLSTECFTSNRDNSCKKALVFSELLQREAASEKNYKCQTAVIGLGGYFVMRDLDGEKRDSLLRQFDYAESICLNL